MAAPSIEELPFDAHVDLLRYFLARRAEIVERIQGVLNAQRKPVAYLRDRRLLARAVDDCFFAGAGADRARLRGRLEEAHWASGFKPRVIAGMHNDLVDPAEMMRRAFHQWQQTRWPGHSGRARYAETLFDLYVVRHVALLAMRSWDAGRAGTRERLAAAQGVLDRLWASGPQDRPVLVRDVRWLIPVAQSYASDDLAPYYETAERIAEDFGDDDRTAVFDAVVRMAGGHLRSYLHYYVTQKGVPLGDGRLVSLARKSNALDFSLLIHGLAPLLEAYERAVAAGDTRRRLTFADGICQGLSPDPDLFVNRVDLLGAYSMVEHLFTATAPDGSVAYTPMGRRHVTLLDEYEARIARLAKPLLDDCRNFAPAEGGYSPYGVLYGFSSNLLEHMAQKTLQPDAVAPFALEDVFTAGGADKRAWVDGWRKLPHIAADVQKLYAYPHAFAAEMFERVERALQRRASGEQLPGALPTGRLFVAGDDDEEARAQASAVPDLPIAYVRSSDRTLVAAQRALPLEHAQLSGERLEGHFIVSYDTAGGAVAIAKDLLTEVLGAGRDAKIVGLPAAAAARVRLMCRGLAR